MRKFLYIMPAVLVCMLYILLAALAGGISGFQTIAFIYIISPLAAGILLRKGKWWGGLFGVVMGLLLICGNLVGDGTISAVLIVGIVFVIYYAIMSILCAAEHKRK